MRTRNWIAALCTLSLAPGVLGGCVTSAPSSPPPTEAKTATSAPAPAQPQLVTLHLATMPIADTVGPFAGDQLGYFKEAGIELKMTKFSGGPETISAIIAGKADIAYAGAVPVLNAVAQGVPLVVVANNSLAQPAPPDPHSILVTTDSGINSLKDLEGKKITTNVIGSISQLYPNELMARNGVNTANLTWVEVPFPAMNDALLQKQVDAIAQIEPFTTILLSTGKVKELGYPFVDVQPSLNIAMWVATKKWVEQNQDTLDRFLKGWDKTVQYMKSNDARTREMITAFTGMKADLANTMRLNQWASKPDVESLRKTAALMRKWKFIDKDIDVQAIVYIPK